MRLRWRHRRLDVSKATCGVTFDTTIAAAVWHTATSTPRENVRLISPSRSTEVIPAFVYSPSLLQMQLSQFISAAQWCLSSADITVPGSCQQRRRAGADSKLHFTRHGISQIHERRTVSGTVVKLPWNFDRYYPPFFSLPHPSPPYARAHPLLSCHSFSFAPCESTVHPRWNYRLFRGGILDFRCEHRGCILNPYSNGEFSRRFRTAILLRLYFLGLHVHYCETLCSPRWDWMVIDCGIIPEAWNRCGQDFSKENMRAHISRKIQFEARHSRVLRGYVSLITFVFSIFFLCVSFLHTFFCHTQWFFNSFYQQVWSNMFKVSMWLEIVSPHVSKARWRAYAEWETVSAYFLWTRYISEIGRVNNLVLYRSLRL